MHDDHEQRVECSAQALRRQCMVAMSKGWSAQLKLLFLFVSPAQHSICCSDACTCSHARTQAGLGLRTNEYARNSRGTGG